MKIRTKSTWKVLLDRERSEDVRKICIIDNINDWVLYIKIEQNKHINRMAENEIVRITRNTDNHQEEEASKDL